MFLEYNHYFQWARTVLTNVVQAKLLGVDLARVGLGGVAHGEDFFLSKLGVIVKVDLGVEADNIALGRLAKGVNLDLGRINRNEKVVQFLNLLSGSDGLIT